MMSTPPHRMNPIYATAAGFCMMALGLCMGRYAYSPLIPPMIDAGWVTKPEAGFLGAFSTLGYLIACVCAIYLPRILAVSLMMRLSFVSIVLGTLMCAWDFGFFWLAIGRTLCGLGGATFVVHTPPVLMQHISDRFKSVSVGIAFAGAGGMLTLISFVLPLFITNGPRPGWFFEAALTFILAAFAWRLASTAPGKAAPRSTKREKLETHHRRPLWLLGSAYFLASLAVIPHTLFLADYMHRDLKMSVGMASTLFAVLGLGCLAGSTTSGVMMTFFGNKVSLIINYLIGLAGLVMVVSTQSLYLATISGFLIGFFLLQCVPLTSLTTRLLVGVDGHPHYWGVLSLGFGSGLVIGSYGMSALLALKWHYLDLFWLALGIQIVGLALILCMCLVSRGKRVSAIAPPTAADSTE